MRQLWAGRALVVSRIRLLMNRGTSDNGDHKKRASQKISSQSKRIFVAPIKPWRPFLNAAQALEQCPYQYLRSWKPKDYPFAGGVELLGSFMNLYTVELRCFLPTEHLILLANRVCALL